MNRFEAAHRQIEADQASGKMPKRKVLPAGYPRAPSARHWRDLVAPLTDLDELLAPADEFLLPSDARRA